MLPDDPEKKRSSKIFFRMDQDFVAILYLKKSEGFSQSCTSQMHDTCPNDSF